MNDDHGMMMILEVIIFASMIFLALIFLYQLTPASTQSDNYSNALKQWGDDALYKIYNYPPPSPYREYPDYPQHMLIHYILSNDYTGLTKEINNILPATVLYNIHISNGIQTAFWCNSFGDNTTILPAIDPVTVSHFIISIDVDHLHDFPYDSGVYIDEDIDDAHSLLEDLFAEYYYGETYDIIVELWYK